MVRADVAFKPCNSLNLAAAERVQVNRLFTM
jgi:hypothetical protein